MWPASCERAAASGGPGAGAAAGEAPDSVLLAVAELETCPWPGGRVCFMSQTMGWGGSEQAPEMATQLFLLFVIVTVGSLCFNFNAFLPTVLSFRLHQVTSLSVLIPPRTKSRPVIKSEMHFTPCSSHTSCWCFKDRKLFGFDMKFLSSFVGELHLL